jgi:hypothetical protein
MLQRFGPLFPMPFHNRFACRYLYPHPTRGIHHSRLFAFHSCQHFYTRCSLRLILILLIRPPSEAAHQGIFLTRKKGGIIIEVEQSRRLADSPKTHSYVLVSMVRWKDTLLYTFIRAARVVSALKMSACQFSGNLPYPIAKPVGSLGTRNR